MTIATRDNLYGSATDTASDAAPTDASAFPARPISPYVTVNGNPSATSRTATVARVAGDLLGGAESIDLGDLPAEALLGRREDSDIVRVLAAIKAAHVLVVATPTDRATCSALTTSIFELLPHDALRGVVVIPIATGTTRDHFLAVDHVLRPVVASLQALTTSTAVFASDADFADDGRPLARLVDAIDFAVTEALVLSRSLRGVA